MVNFVYEMCMAICCCCWILLFVVDVLSSIELYKKKSSSNFFLLFRKNSELDYILKDFRTISGCDTLVIYWLCVDDVAHGSGFITTLFCNQNRCQIQPFRCDRQSPRFYSAVESLNVVKSLYLFKRFIGITKEYWGIYDTNTHTHTQPHIQGLSLKQHQCELFTFCVNIFHIRLMF